MCDLLWTFVIILPCTLNTTILCHRKCYCVCCTVLYLLLNLHCAVLYTLQLSYVQCNFPLVCNTHCKVYFYIVLLLTSTPVPWLTLHSKMHLLSVSHLITYAGYSSAHVCTARYDSDEYTQIYIPVRRAKAAHTFPVTHECSVSQQCVCIVLSVSSRWGGGGAAA